MSTYLEQFPDSMCFLETKFSSWFLSVWEIAAPNVQGKHKLFPALVKSTKKKWCTSSQAEFTVFKLFLKSETWEKGQT